MTRLDGERRLDWGQSDSFEPVMKVLEVSWLMMDRHVVLPSGRQARLVETRSLDSDPDKLISKLEVFVDGKHEASVTRAFEREVD